VKINKIHAVNYRTLADTTITFSSHYCAISGHNNAGKSCIVRLILHLFDEMTHPWESYSISYQEDKTQWIKDSADIIIEYSLTASTSDDSSLVSVLSKLSSRDFTGDAIEIFIRLKVTSENDRSGFVSINGNELDAVATRQFLRTIRTSNQLLSHNSTASQEDYYISRGRHGVMYEFFLSKTDRKSLADAEIALQRRAKRVARDHKAALGSMLGKLKDNFEVEFTVPEASLASRRMPLVINLSDRNVEVPLTNWGSGTQNRTYILLSILRASRIRNREAPDNRTTPIVLIEEPESFLHPSAQAEFGAVLQILSEEEAIQIIVSTHSPFMLNQVDPTSNILLKRVAQRGKSLETIVEDTSGSEWMKPFADHLGIIPEEFQSWRDVIGSSDKCLLLVEGETDKQYIEFLRSKFPKHFPIPSDVKVLPYGGRDALKNTTIIAFVKQIVPRVFVTFDLDSKNQVQRHLEQIGLEEKRISWR
jgi:putative ATP-dependent endonuclease of the OLD family